LQIDALADEVRDDSCGAIATFVGTVRSSAAAEGKRHERVLALEYEAQVDMAEKRMREIVDTAAARWGLVRAVAVHRVGTCELGDPTVFIGCSAPHRKEALEACHWIIDELKRSVPIWKKEMYSDGSSWVGAEGERT
jgi:molybdopterin synthase catalytic subunit